MYNYIVGEVVKDALDFVEASEMEPLPALNRNMGKSRKACCSKLKLGPRECRERHRKDIACCMNPLLCAL